MGSVLFLLLSFAFIFFVARGCVATQEATQVRKYVTNADTLLSDSSNLGNESLQGTLQSAGGEPARLGEEALGQIENRTQSLYFQALQNDEVPPEFEDAHHYLITALGIRYQATSRLAGAASGDAESFTEALATAVEDYKLSDAIAMNHYIPEVHEALDEAGQSGDQGYLEEPEPFMDYEHTGFDAASQAGAAARSDPSALHGVQIAGVEVAGQPLYAGGNVVLTGADEPTFAVTVSNGGETPETAVPVEVILNTRAERQSQTATIDRIEPNGGTATAQVSGFLPGELDETAEVTVEVGPVKYEDYLANNTLKGYVTFGL
jgi:hypothetical protein